MDLRRRTWVKSISWRLLGVVIQAVITYAFTRSWGETLGITGIFQTIRFFLYYAHERLWERIAWGRVRHPLSHLRLRGDLAADDLATIERLLARERYLAHPPEYEI